MLLDAYLHSWKYSTYSFDRFFISNWASSTHHINLRHGQCIFRPGSMPGPRASYHPTHVDISVIEHSFEEYAAQEHHRLADLW